MVRTLSSGLTTHMAASTTTMAMCWKLTRTDGVVLGFTDHDQNITFASQLYTASSGFQASQIEQRDDLSIDTVSLIGFLNSANIAENDLLAGKYDYAAVEIFILNYQDISQGRILQKKGWLGQIEIRRGQFEAELRGFAQKTTQTIGRLYTPSCDAILGDSRCSLALTSFTDTVTISSVTNQQNFTCNTLSRADGFHKGGKVTWTSGHNNGLSMEISEQIGSDISLVMPMPYTVSVGDNVSIVAGCDKTSTTCKSKFNNFINFQGFPHIPGQDKLYETSGTSS